jgi:hypothetical protein
LIYSGVVSGAGHQVEELGHHQQTVGDSLLSFKIQSFIISYEMFMNIDMEKVKEETYLYYNRDVR